MNISLTEAEEKLATLIWSNAPITSPDLVTLADRELKWKKSTTYTVLKKICEKDVVKNDNAFVTVLLTRDELISHQSRHFMEDRFGGSLPKFIAAFTGGRKLTQKQADELRSLIEESEE
jgi:predicted transcriptional regulator